MDIVECILCVLKMAVLEFYEKDKKLLWSTLPVNECAMVACIYRYMWALMRNHGVLHNYDIDVEYARQICGENLEEQKKIMTFGDCNAKECHCRVILDRIRKNEEGIKGIKREINDHEIRDEFEREMIKKFRPDIVVHKRNINANDEFVNLLVVEFKKAKVNEKDEEFDKAKIRYCMCEKRNLKYKCGAFVVLRDEAPQIEVLRNADEDWNVIGRRVNMECQENCLMWGKYKQND